MTSSLRSSIFSDSETETISDDTDLTSGSTKKNQHQASTRSNRSHTTYFFRVSDELAYCKICESNFAGTNQAAYGYSRKGGNTTNLLAHL